MPLPEIVQPEDEIGMAFDRAPVGLCVSRQRIVRRCNDTFATMFGLPRSAIEGASFASLYPSSDEFEHIGAHGLALMRKTGTYSDERIMRRGNGELFWCHASGRSLSLVDPFACAVWMFEDISSRRSVAADLTSREREIVRQLATGLSTKQTARVLGVSPRTIDGHRARIMKKAGRQQRE